MVGSACEACIGAKSLHCLDVAGAQGSLSGGNIHPYAVVTVVICRYHGLPLYRGPKQPSELLSLRSSKLGPRQARHYNHDCWACERGGCGQLYVYKRAVRYECFRSRITRYANLLNISVVRRPIAL